MAVKKRKITWQGKDGEVVAEFIKKTLQTRKGGKYRKTAERMWTEVDRQVAMESMARQKRDPQEESNNWRSAIELGELSRASEVLSADIRRMAFPQNRAWFDPHVELRPEDIKEGVELQKTQEEVQNFNDGVLRALMAQQHLDFGLKQRTDLSIKEALHHGGYVAEVDEITMLGSTPDGKVDEITAPAWVPHSMWNCYPDDAPSVMAGTLFYTGSMIICAYMSHSAIMQVSEAGWIKENVRDLEDPKDKEHEITWYHGAITIPRTKGSDIYLPNVKVGSVKDKLVYYKANDLKHSRIIYNGYERLDVRNPYFISPLMKMSPTQKIASVFTNNLLDIVERHGDPAVIYDGNDPDLVRNGGPNTAPGSKTPSKNLANFKEISLGDPGAVLTAVQFNIAELQKGTSVDSIRSGMSSSTEQTATEVERTRQGGQIRTVDFLDKHELQGLRPFLYLQHESNKNNLKTYKFYSPEMDMPDFITVKRDELPDNVNFDVVGSKGLIEESQRQQATMQVTQFLLNAGYNKINIDKLAKEMYQDAGNKNPERFLNITDEATAAQQLEQIQAQMQQLTEQAQVIQAENEELKQKEESAIQEIQAKASIEMAKQDNQEDQIKVKADHDMEKLQLEFDLQTKEADDKLTIEMQKLENQKEIERFKVEMSNTTHESLGKVAEIKKEDLTGIDKMKAVSDEMKETLKEFSRIQSAPTKVIRDENGKIIGAKKELNS